ALQESVRLPTVVRNRGCQERARIVRDTPMQLVLAGPGSRNIPLPPTAVEHEADRWKGRELSWLPPGAFARTRVAPRPGPAWRAPSRTWDRLGRLVREGPWQRVHRIAAVWRRLVHRTLPLPDPAAARQAHRLRRNSVEAQFQAGSSVALQHPRP